MTGVYMESKCVPIQGRPAGLQIAGHATAAFSGATNVLPQQPDNVTRHPV